MWHVLHCNGEEVDNIELSEISPVAKRRRKYVIVDSDSELNILCIEKTKNLGIPKLCFIYHIYLINSLANYLIRAPKDFSKRH